MPAIEPAESKRDRQEADNGTLRLYASVGPEILHYVVDEKNLALIKLNDSVTLSEKVQYACADQRGCFLYVLSSNGAPGTEGTRHYVSSFCIDASSGVLHPLGRRIALPHRPIHIAVDASSEYVLITYISSRSITVLQIAEDGSLDCEVEQPSNLDTGSFAHQAYVMPSNKMAIVVARGIDASEEQPERPGALQIFKYERGVLRNWKSIAPGRGYGFGPRNIDINPSQSWLYASLERQNKMYAFRLEGDSISEEPQFVCETLSVSSNVRPKQMAGAVLVHPTGRFVYLANRAFGTTEQNGRNVYAGGENSIAVFRIDEMTGKPTLIQCEDTHGIYPRTFSIDPKGKILIVANIRSLLVSKGTSLDMVPANISILSIGDDGMLRYVRKYEIEANGHDLFWSDLVSCPGNSRA